MFWWAEEAVKLDIVSRGTNNAELYAGRPKYRPDNLAPQQK